jgi:hypothetical protein
VLSAPEVPRARLFALKASSSWAALPRRSLSARVVMYCLATGRWLLNSPVPDSHDTSAVSPLPLGALRRLPGRQQRPRPGDQEVVQNRLLHAELSTRWASRRQVYSGTCTAPAGEGAERL